MTCVPYIVTGVEFCNVCMENNSYTKLKRRFGCARKQAVKSRIDEVNVCMFIVYDQFVFILRFTKCGCQSKYGIESVIV